MGELFVRESAIASEKVAEEQQKNEVQKKSAGTEYIKSKKWETPAIVYSHDEAVEESIQYFNGDISVYANRQYQFGNMRFIH